MVINTNIQAQINADNLQSTQSRLGKSLARLSSSQRIVDPSDDAGGLAVAARLDSQISRLQAARYNVGNATSFVQTQDGFLKKIGKALDRMGELSVLAQDATKTDSDRSLYNKEFNELSQYMQYAATKDFNGVSLFSASQITLVIDSDGSTFTMQGINLGQSPYTDLTSSNISTTTAATAALNNVKSTINTLSADRATLGSYQSRLSYMSEQLTVSKENLTAATSRIKDVDIAEESTEFAKQQMLMQSGTAMLAQANQLPQNMLKLLQ
jgi:flagellin